MTITIEVPTELEARIRASAAHGDVEAVRKLLLEAVSPVAISLTSQPAAELTDQEFESLLDELDQITLETAGDNPPVLSDYAVSRASIYEDHP
jgi:antitoxin ParD1/3/4